MIDFGARIRELDVATDAEPCGHLTRASQYEFTYGERVRHPASLIMPVGDRDFRDGELFAVMDMNLPESFLLTQIRDRSPKVAPTKMRLRIGWLAYSRPGASAPGLRRGDKSREYPLPEALGVFGREVCGVVRPSVRIARLIDAMAETLRAAKRDERVRSALRQGLPSEWEHSMRRFRPQ